MIKNFCTLDISIIIQYIIKFIYDDYFGTFSHVYLLYIDNIYDITSIIDKEQQVKDIFIKNINNNFNIVYEIKKLFKGEENKGITSEGIDDEAKFSDLGDY